ncbi:MAG: Transposase-like protein, partial [Polaromonas sp.]|nr:Transposase-like protein [Polaromonas sp.]
SGLLLPRERSKTLTALVGAEPWIAGPGGRGAAAAVLPVRGRLALLAAEPATSASAEGVLIIDNTGDRKDSSATDHVTRQYLGSAGTIDNGIVAVTTLWADEAHYYPLHVAQYTPATCLPDGRHDVAFRTKPQIALDLARRAQAAGIAFGVIVADCIYGDDRALEKALLDRRLPHVLTRRGALGHGRAPAEADRRVAQHTHDLLFSCPSLILAVGKEVAQPPRSLGLGLFIVCKIIQAHNSTVIANSDEKHTVLTVLIARTMTAAKAVKSSGATYPSTAGCVARRETASR